MPASPHHRKPGTAADALSLWIAQGLGIGRIPWAPGTFGSVLGVAWFALLLAPGSWLIFSTGIVLSAAASVWFCGRAEKILGRTDPGSVVIDEVIAVPLCFAGWLILGGAPLPSTPAFFSNQPWGIFGVFLAFRFFDVAKPWPVRQSQHLPGGWGVTVDDLLATLYVNVVVVAWIFGYRAFAA